MLNRSYRPRFNVIRLLSFALATSLLLTACTPLPVPQQQTPWGAAPPLAVTPPGLDGESAARNFVQVIASVEPVAEAVCREKRPDLNCDFRILVDDTPGKAANAFQTLDPQSGQPVIGFTLALIEDARNRDELAFILGHEAGHHLAGHLPRQRQSATAGALVLGTLAALTGAEGEALRQATQIGATVGARSYSKDFELEADALGTLIAWRAGYDPERGAAFFTRIPDPGNRFLGSHPPNQSRMATVAGTMAGIRAGRIR